MWLECTCVDINQQKWDELMKGAKPLNYKWLVAKIRRELPKVYRDLDLDLYNPYSNQCYVTKTHYILVHSAIEYFFNKGEDPNKEWDDLDDYYPNNKNNIYYENRQIRKNKLNEETNLPSSIFSSQITPEEHEIGLKLARYSTKETSFLFGGMLEYFSTVAKILLNKFPKYDVENIVTNPYEIIDCCIESSIETNGLEPKWQNITRYAGRKKSTTEFVEWFRNVALPRMGEKLKPNDASQINECLNCLEDFVLIQQKVEELKKERVFMQNVLYQLAICKYRLQVFNNGEDNEFFKNSSYKYGNQTIPLGCGIRKSTIVKLLQIIVNNLLNNQNTLNMKTTIKLTENDLHRIIKESVKRVLKEEYGVAPDGRQINQQAAQQAASTPTSWEAYAQLANRRGLNTKRGNNYYQKAHDAANQQLTYQGTNGNSDEIVYPYLKGHNLNVSQSKKYSNNEPSMDEWLDNPRKIYHKNFKNPSKSEQRYYRAEELPEPSKEFRQAANYADNRMTRFYNGDWHRDMANKPLGNKGVYESKRVSKRNKLVE